MVDRLRASRVLRLSLSRDPGGATPETSPVLPYRGLRSTATRPVSHTAAAAAAAAVAPFNSLDGGPPVDPPPTFRIVPPLPAPVSSTSASALVSLSIGAPACATAVPITVDDVPPRALVPATSPTTAGSTQRGDFVAVAAVASGRETPFPARRLASPPGTAVGSAPLPALCAPLGSRRSPGAYGIAAGAAGDTTMRPPPLACELPLFRSMEVVVVLGVVVVVAAAVAGLVVAWSVAAAGDEIAAGGRVILGSGGGRVMGDIARRSCWNDVETSVQENVGGIHTDWVLGRAGGGCHLYRETASAGQLVVLQSEDRACPISCGRSYSMVIVTLLVIIVGPSPSLEALFRSGCYL